jgi:hypothetical protein
MRDRNEHDLNNLLNNMEAKTKASIAIKLIKRHK